MTNETNHDATMRLIAGVEEMLAYFQANWKGLGARFTHLELLEPSGTSGNLLLRNPNPGGSRIHLEPNGIIDMGVTAKVDLMMDPYDDDPVNYRIGNQYTYVGDPNGNGEGAVIVYGAKSTGSHWGSWPSMHFSFQDDGRDASAFKVWYGDHNMPEHFAPMRGGFLSDKNFETDDYITNDQNIYRCVAGGVSGATAPTHETGIVSDGNLDWEHVWNVNYQNVRAVAAFADRDEMPVLGYKDVRAQFLNNALFGWGSRMFGVDNDGNEIGGFRTGGSAANQFFELYASGGGFLRFHQGENYMQFVDLAECGSIHVVPDGDTSIDVSGKTDLLFDNAVPTVITNLTGGSHAQRITITSSNGNTTLAHTGGSQTGGVIWNATEADLVLSKFGAVELVANSGGDLWRVKA